MDKFAEASKLSMAIDSLTEVVRAMRGSVGYEHITTAELEDIRESAVSLIKSVRIS